MVPQSSELKKRKMALERLLVAIILICNLNSFSLKSTLDCLRKNKWKIQVKRFELYSIEEIMKKKWMIVSVTFLL